MMEVTHAPAIAYEPKEKTKDEILEETAKAVKDSSDKQVFIDYLEAFKEAEREHIENFLTEGNFNLRNASLCAEAYAAAELLQKLIIE
jgi:hypothetical protein